MKFHAVLDVSSIVWDRDHYERETDKYFCFKDQIVLFIQTLEKEHPSFLMRSELLEEIINGFPFDVMPEQFYEFGNVVYGFLDRMASDIIEFQPRHLEGLTWNPEVIKPHFSNIIKEEIQFLLSHMHSQEDIESIFFTFKLLWASNTDLVTCSSTGEKRYMTVVSDDGPSLDVFFRQFKKVFEHNDKHHSGRAPGDYIAPLTCFDGKDISVPQALLDNAIMVGKRYYNYDNVNNTYVVFVSSGGNAYHGYDEVDINKIPPSLRKVLKGR